MRKHRSPQRIVELGKFDPPYGMRLTAALCNGAVRGQPVDSHVIIVTHQ